MSDDNQPQRREYNVMAKFTDWRNVTHCETIPVFAVSQQAAVNRVVEDLKKHNPFGLHIDYVTA